MTSKDYADVIKAGGHVHVKGQTIRVIAPQFKNGRKISLTTMGAIQSRIALVPVLTGDGTNWVAK